MKGKQTIPTLWSHGLIWFGAAVSMAEIMTGSLLAPLGFWPGLGAILCGHLVGGALFFGAGLIGARTGRSAMGTVKISFGSRGAWLFSGLNVLQLVGWTAVMLAVGTQAAQFLCPLVWPQIWTLFMGGLIALWLALGVRDLTRLNVAVMAALFGLTLLLSLQVFQGGMTPATRGGTMSFGAALELATVMPLSWLPLVSDYTRASDKRKSAAALTSSVVYNLTSCWMYAIGLGAAVFAGESDFTRILIASGMGLGGLVIVLLSTVTTGFLDVYSGGVSATAINRSLPEKKAAFGVCALGTLLALFAPMDSYEGFLYLIGSVFAPMAAIQIVDVFVLRRAALERSAFDEQSPDRLWDGVNLLVWLIGFILYRLLIRIDLPMGNTLPVMAITAALCWLVGRLRGTDTTSPVPATSIAWSAQATKSDTKTEA